VLRSHRPGALSDGNKAALFDGTSGFCREAGGGLAVAASSITLEGWINRNGVNNTALQIFLNVGNIGDYLGISSGLVFGSLRISGVQRTVTGTLVPLTGWHHLALTWTSGDSIRLYFDGQLCFTSAVFAGTIDASTAGGTTIGCFDGASPIARYQGFLDDLAWYGTQLTPAQIAENYAARLATMDQTSKVLHVGTLDTIVADPDHFAGTFEVHCTSLDYMDDLAKAPSSGLSILQNVRDDQIFSAVIVGMPRQPDAIQVYPGPDTFPVALDKVDNKTKRYTILQDTALSSLSLVYVQGDTLVYEPRNVRASTTTAIDTFTSRLVGLEVERARSTRLNRVEVTAHPRKIDPAATTILWELPAGNPIFLPGNTSIVLWTPFTDPANKSQAIGALSVQNLVPTTDYLFNENSTGTGQNRTANLAVTIEPFTATAKLTISNTGPDGYVTAARVLGKGIYDYAAALLQAEDTASQVQSGLNLLSFDAPYQGKHFDGVRVRRVPRRTVWLVRNSGEESQVPHSAP
jgi:hypothetical protein